jgi:hypothetical protein
MPLTIKGAPPVARIRTVARKLTERQAKRNDVDGVSLKPMKRHKSRARARRMIAYDLETTRIAAGCPTPLYITAYGDDFKISQPVGTMQNLAAILLEHFLTDDLDRARFVAWNGNKFDGFIIGSALMLIEGIEIIPYLAKGSLLRGFKVLAIGTKLAWEFLDGIAMTGVQSKLEDFLKVFAPQFPKLAGTIDFEREDFNPDNAAHVAYAERDAEGLWHGVTRAQQILMDTFDVPLQATIGNAGIKIFQQEMPAGVNVWGPPFRAEMAIREHAYRGGYCYLMGKYSGPTYKYDLNQAYAAAMRETDLPGGRCYAVKKYDPTTPGIYRVIAEKKGNRIPFYFKPEPTQGCYTLDKLTDTWITSIEFDQLTAEGWTVQVIEGFAWENKFRMDDFVNKLEQLRINAADGPNGALGTMCKSLGNNSYGKTCEKLDGLEFRLALKKPEGYSRSIPGDDADSLPFLWYRINKPLLRPYHQPQIAAFITAHVRMVVRRAALLSPDFFVYADTDCVVFKKPIQLPTDAKIYGKWKIEVAGDDYGFITKKVYFSRLNYETAVKRAKGMTVSKLTFQQFVDWFDGSPPQQSQLQRRGFLSVITGADMFVSRQKVGQVLKNLAHAA